MTTEEGRIERPEKIEKAMPYTPPAVVQYVAWLEERVASTRRERDTVREELDAVKLRAKEVADLVDELRTERDALARASSPANGSVTSTELGPFVATSQTSREAAVHNYPLSGTQRARVLLALDRATAEGRGLTRDELADHLKLGANSVRPRITELMAMGLVTACEERRRAAGGQKGEVLKATEAGTAAADELREELAAQRASALA